MRSLRPSPCLQPQGQALGATLRAACAVQIGYPADLSRLSFYRQRARVHCAHPPAYSCRGRLWPQPNGRLSPCKSSVLSICPSTRQICLEQIWTSGGRPQGVRHGRRTSTTAMLSVPVSSTGQAPAPAGGKNPVRSSHHLVRTAGSPPGHIHMTENNGFD